MSRAARIAVFASAVAFQVAILAVLPSGDLFTRATGRTVLLPIVPVDPYTFLSGYYLTLGYEMSRLPAGFAAEEGEAVWVVLQEGSDGLWHPARWEKDRPQGLGPAEAGVRGVRRGVRVEYGIEMLFVPEETRFSAEKDLRDNIKSAHAEVRVGANGDAALVRLRVGDRVYE